MRKLKQFAYNIAVRLFPSRMGYIIKPKGEGYFNAKTIVAQARDQGMGVVEYLEKENIGGVGKRRDLIVDQLRLFGVLDGSQTILEIGVGTGMYLQQFIKFARPAKAEVYETDPGWSKYLNEEYASKVSDLKVHNADGFSLRYTADSSVDLVSAHGVFVYLPIVVTFQYLQEAVRVCKTNGTIVFDFFSNRIFTPDEIIRFKTVNPYYDFPVVIDESAIQNFCEAHRLRLVAHFDVPYHQTHSTYYVVTKIE